MTTNNTNQSKIDQVRHTESKMEQQNNTQETSKHKSPYHTSNNLRTHNPHSNHDTLPPKHTQPTTNTTHIATMTHPTPNQYKARKVSDL